MSTKRTSNALTYTMIGGMIFATFLGMANLASPTSAKKYIQKQGVELKTITPSQLECYAKQWYSVKDTGAGFRFTGTKDGKEVKGLVCMNYVQSNYFELN